MSWPRLVTTAYLLTGDLDRAKELARDTLVVVCSRWRRIPRDDVDFYARRSLVKGHLRRARRRKPVPQGALGALSALTALSAVSARQRVVLVMLHAEGLGEVEISQLLGCSAGTVRSLAQRGLAVCGAGSGRGGGGGHGGGSGAERLRGLFAEAAEAAEIAEVIGVVEVVELGDNSVPFALPLGAIEQRGRARRRRRTGAVAAVCALLLAPTAVFAAERIGVFGAAESSGPSSAAQAGSPVRIVAPGERVQVVKGVQVWLTADGEHWSTPTGSNQFRGPADGSTDDAKSGVSAQAEAVNDKYFLSGLYHGLAADPGRVAVTVGDATVNGAVLTLAGSPGWGFWYSNTLLTGSELKSVFAEGFDDTRGRASRASGERGADGPAVVTVYDADAKVVARTDELR
ncbi:sigma factor-like helix-turn-helix DNA-binding protein [Streptomyces sp. NPDC020951]|uniref:sigma factor-like helix-turn-helix DNA-binding protein n=1 Tax=Streptomyces sp. NPDC020951 TaxID=3365104 RepID=UPI0037B797DD